MLAVMAEVKSQPQEVVEVLVPIGASFGIQKKQQ